MLTIMNKIKHRFVALDYMKGLLHYVDEYNQDANWSVPSGGMLQDMQLAGNGRLIVSLNDGWSFRKLSEGSECGQIKTDVSGISSLRLLPFGKVFAGVNAKEGIELVEFDECGNVLRHFDFHDFRDLRQLRQTPQGSWLVTHHDGAIEVLLEDRPRILRQFTMPSVKYAYQALRKPDGNYLLSGGYSLSTFELTPEGKCIRRFSALQPEGMVSYYYSGFQLLDNGHLVQANWNGHNDADYHEGLKLFEFDPSGNEVWSWTAPKEKVGAITAFIVLDGLDVSLQHDDSNGPMEAALL